jgi:hypothetical protein
MKNLILKKLMCAASAMVLLPLVSFAQGSSVSAAPTATPVKPEKIFGATISIENAQNLYSDQDYQKVNEIDLMISPSIKLGTRFNLKITSLLKQNQTGGKEAELSNTGVLLSMKEMDTALGPFKWKPSLGGVLPTDSIENKQTHFKGAVGVGSTFHAAELTKSFPLEVGWTLQIGKNIHEYNLDSDGNPLVEWVGKSVVSLSYPISKIISLAVDSSYIVGKTYGGFSREIYANAIDLNFEIIKSTLAMNIGASTDGNAFKYDGTTSNYSFFNDNVSVLRIGATYVY